jgi:hypothetical protein
MNIKFKRKTAQYAYFHVLRTLTVFLFLILLRMTQKNYIFKSCLKAYFNSLTGVV